MYMSKMLSIGKVDNGFVIECQVPLKKDSKKSKEMDVCCSSSCEKQYIAKDAAQAAKLIQDMIPLLDAEYKSENEFDSAFDEAAGEMEKGDKD